MSQALAEPQIQAAALYNLGRLYAESHQLPLAEKTLKSCFELDQAQGSDAEKFRTLLALSKLSEASHGFSEAMGYAQQALEVAQHSADPVLVASGFLRLAYLAEESGRIDQAKTHYRQALSVAETGLTTENRDYILNRLTELETPPHED